MSLRRVLTGIVLLLVTGLLASQVRNLLANPTIWPPDDFIEYWSAARLTWVGENPYDPDLLLPLQVANGRQTEDAVMMWNPPWALTVVLPLGLLPAREAQLLWLALNFLAMLYCGDRLWKIYGGSSNRRWIGWAIVLVALPTLFALQSGQISPLLLLGAVLFLEARHRGWDFLAGLSTVLLAIKPHLAYLVWVAIFLDTVERRRWKVLLGGAFAGGLGSAIPLMLNPSVWHQYVVAFSHPPAQWISPTLGSVLRLLFGTNVFGLQFVPIVFGLVWFIKHYSNTSKNWNWEFELPGLLLVSFVTAPYGAWPFDLVLVLPAVMLMIRNWQPSQFLILSLSESSGQSKRPSLPTFAGLIAINLACLILNLLQFSSFWYIWVAPAVLVLFVGVRRPLRIRDSVQWVQA
jgi:hypothetical protein